MDITYKFLVEDNIAKIKENVSAQLIADGLFQYELIDRTQFDHFKTLPNDESLEILFKNLSQCDNAGKKYKHLIEDVIQSKYDWLYNDLHENLTDTNWIQDKYKNCLNFGDFPRKPAHYVERSDKIRQVQDLLKKLSSIGKVILCGMTGSGKTSLIIGIMTKEMVLDMCGGNVFWITVGDADEEQLLMLLYRFYLKLSDDNMQENNLFSSKEVLKDKLKKRIRKYFVYSQMLLVLDNVCNRNAIEAFDIGCKVLITTQNRDIWNQDLDTEFIEVDGSFQFDETCSLFAKCLDKPVSYVRGIDEVRQIHSLCQGHPFSIALFGSQIATYKDKLLDKKSKMWKSLSGILQKNSEDQQNSVISSCIETLDEETCNKYLDFAIFPDDVNISSKVLQIMWDLQEMEVIEVMRKLENKSLIVSYYSNDLHNYIFGVHVVLLAYLKNRYRQELMEKHRKLISAYKKNCNGDFSRLTNDNYIFQYIGYHLKQAECFQDFKIYFDLKFIGAKIKVTGIGDVLKDFNLYRKEIQGNTFGNSNDIITEIETFVKKFGDDMHKYEDISIIQCALKYDKDSFIYKTAMDTAKNSPTSLYFEIDVARKSCDNHVSEFDLPEDCTFVCFAKEDQQLLLGTKKGVIELWDRTYRKIICKFIGHTQSIKYIELDPERNAFLSVSDDGLVYLWKFRLHKRDSLPSLVQSNHRTFFGEENNVSPSYTFKPEENDHFVTASFCNDYPKDPSIVIGSLRGEIRVCTDGNIKSIHLNTNVPIENLKFSEDDTLILGNCHNKLLVWTSDLTVTIFEVMDLPIISILIYDDDLFVTLHESSVVLWRFKSKRMPGDQLPGIKGNRLCNSMVNQKFTCCLIEENLLYVIATDYKINVFDISGKPRMKTICSYDNEINDCITAGDVYLTDMRESTLFLLRYRNNVLKFHTPITLINHNRKHKPVFDSFWTEKQVRLVSVDPNNSIQISNNFNLLSELDPIDRAVTTIVFSPCGNSIVFGLETGEVFEYEIKTKQRKSVMRLPSSISLLRYYADGRVVVGGKKGDLMMRYRERNDCLIANSEFSRITPEPIVQIFYFDESNTLLTISADRGIKLWYLDRGSMHVLRGPKQSHVTHVVQMSEMSKDGKLLVLTMSSMFDLFLIEHQDDRLNLVDFGGTEVKHELYSCCFSNDSKYLAVGSVDGVIIVYNMDLYGRSFNEYARLYSHVSVVRCLKFAPGHSNLLVSVGEQVIWWDLNKVPKNSITRNRRSRRIRPPLDDLITMTENLVIPHSMCNRVGSETKPHLLRAIKFKGSYANAVSVSPNFKTFVTRDNEGISYIIKMIE